jgi:hypothetical protein
MSPRGSIPMSLDDKMRAMSLKFVSMSQAKLGRCTKCMRQVFLLASIGWLIFGLIWFVRPSGLVLGLLAAWSCGVTTWWMLHVGAYAARKMVIAYRTSDFDFGGGETSADDGSTSSHPSGSFMRGCKALWTGLKAVWRASAASVGSGILHTDPSELPDPVTIDPNAPYPLNAFVASSPYRKKRAYRKSSEISQSEQHY